MKMSKVTIDTAIEMAKEGQSLKGVVIEDLNDVQVDALDVLLLSDHGIVVPEQNIYYDDDKITYDPEFDEVQWTKLPSDVTLEDQVEMTKRFNNSKKRSIQIELNVDEETAEWANKNYDKLKGLLDKMVVELYNARTVLGE